MSATACGLFGGLPTLWAAEKSADVKIKPWPRAIVEKNQISTVWADGRHNAFPGIARVGGFYYITFRHAAGHPMGQAGSAKIFVIRSKVGDLKKWDKVAEFTHAHDARDPLVFDNQGRVQVVYHSQEDFYSQSADGVTWSPPRELDTEVPAPLPGSKLAFTSHRRWLFRIRKGPDGAFYSLGRCGITVKGSPGKFGLILYRSEDGVKFKALHSYGEGPSAGMGPGRNTGHEADIAWAPDGTLISGIRDARRDGVIVMGRAPNGPWRNFGSGIVTFGGPAFHTTKQGGLLLAARHSVDEAAKVKTYTSRIVSVTSEGVSHPFDIRCGNDSAYQSFADGPDNTVLMAYYSNHERPAKSEPGVAPANIYLARLTIRHEPVK